MGRRATSPKVKAEARRPHARKAPKQEAAGTRELEKRLAEALEQQTATAHILSIIRSSPTDIQPVLDAVAESAARLCDAADVIVRRVDGGVYRLVAHVGSMRVTPSPPVLAISRRTFMGRAIRERRTIHIHDVLDPHVGEEYPESLSFLRQDPAYRTVLCVPLLREDTAIGVIVMRRPEMRPFSDKQIKLLEIFADQAVIAIENVRLFNETKEALEQQTATADILRVISSSSTDIQPVLDAVAESAARLCEATDVVIRRLDGDRLRIVAHFGSVPVTVDAHEITRGSVGGRAVLECRTVHVHDVLSGASRKEYPDAPALQSRAGHRTILAVPLAREGAATGIILMRRLEVRPFTDKQIQLLETFASQAVIAIENARLFNETNEALEQQTATADVLKLISRTTFELQPVLDTLVRSAAELCEAQHALYYRIDPDGLRPEAWHNVRDEYITFRKANPIPVAANFNMGRATLMRQPVHIHDMLAEPGLGSAQAVRFLEMRTVLGVPVLRVGEPIGVIGIFRQEVRPFTRKQIELVTTFADQAAIAIGNVRLFKELQARNAEVTEALEQQTATADILRVISSSPTDLQPVFDAILEKAIRLCDAHMGQLGLYDGEYVEIVAQRGASAEYARFLSERGPFHPPAGVPLARMIAGRQPIHDADVSDTSEYRAGFPGVVALVELGGARTSITVPMLKEGRVVGCIIIYRPDVQPFTQKQIDLVSTFANQAVIAIENVRLFKELQARNAEVTAALEQQTATAEVLKVISRSTFDLETVLQTLVDNAAILCRATRGVMFRRDGDVYRLAATYNVTPELREYLQSHPVPPDRATISGRSIMEKRPVHVQDVLADSEYQWGDAARLGNYRTVLSVPLLREGEPMGTIALTRDAVEPFSEQEIALVTTFADQATIAIENVRLFNEIQDKSRQLEVASRHKSQFLANMSHELRTPLNAILGYTELVLDGIYGDVSEKVRDVMGRVDKSGRHLLGLINDVLDLSKIEAGQLTLALADYSLTDVAQTVSTAVESLAAEKKLALKVALAPDLPRGRGDDRRLAQVLLNLVGNAIKFTEAGEVRLEARCSNGEFVVSVADTGPGISAADQQRIFEEFQQVDDSATRKKGGTGLGLSIAKRIVELHGGRIEVESAPGRGATFTVTLPVRVERQAVPA